MEREIIYIKSWKGKDNISVLRTTEGYKVVEHRKDKETEEVKTNEHFIPFDNVLNLKIIIDNLDVGYKVGYRYIVNKIKELYGFDVDIEAFNGGRNRAKFYFPYYYYPMKILEAKGIIRYYGRGGCERIK